MLANRETLHSAETAPQSWDAAHRRLLWALAELTVLEDVACLTGGESSACQGLDRVLAILAGALDLEQHAQEELECQASDEANSVRDLLFRRGNPDGLNALTAAVVKAYQTWREAPREQIPVWIEGARQLRSLWSSHLSSMSRASG